MNSIHTLIVLRFSRNIFFFKPDYFYDYLFKCMKKVDKRQFVGYWTQIKRVHQEDEQYKIKNAL